MKKPNILFAIADDASHFGIYGHNFVKTPTIDWIGKNGIVFDNAFTTNPKCAPSRASILTGKQTWELEEACSHFSVWPNNVSVYPDLLEEVGYKVGFTGKGWGPGDYSQSGRNRNPAGDEFNNYNLTPPNTSAINTCDYEKNFLDFLNSCEENPFCFWFGCREPHRPYKIGEGIKNGKTHEELRILPAYWPDDDIVRSDVLDYAFEIEWFDTQLNKMIKILKQKGMLDNTIIIVTSDNGCPFPRVKGQMYEDDMHLPMVLMWKDTVLQHRICTDFISFTDFAPTFLEIAGIEISPSLSGKSFYHLIVDTNKTKGREYICFGRERHDLGRKDDLGYPVRCIRDTNYLYIRNFEPDRWPAGDPETGYKNCDNGPTKQRILDLHAHGNRFYYSLSFGRRPEHELYDIVNDSECINNLADNSNYAKIRKDLWRKLKKFLQDTGDQRILGNKDYYEQHPYTGSHKNSWKSYLEDRSTKTQTFEKNYKETNIILEKN